MAGSTSTAIHVRSFWEGEQTLARVVPRPEHTSLPGYVYGGLITSAIDCHSTGSAAAAAHRAAGGALEAGALPRVVGRHPVDGVDPQERRVLLVAGLGPGVSLHEVALAEGEPPHVGRRDVDVTRSREEAARPQEPVALVAQLEQALDLDRLAGRLLLASILAGVLSHGPAGLGVLESMLFLLLPHVPPEQLLAAVLLYRVIYEVIPLVFALGLWGAYELVADDGARMRLLRPVAAERPPTRP